MRQLKLKVSNLKKGLFFAMIGALILTGLLYTHYAVKEHHSKVKSKPQAYAYQNYLGPANPALIIENLSLKDKLINYYEQREESPTSNPGIGVPLKTLPMYEPIYVISFTEDSLLAEVVSYYNYGARRGGRYTRGWVYIKTLHSSPPTKN